jgi:hypothetical protein
MELFFTEFVFCGVQKYPDFLKKTLKIVSLRKNLE